MVEIDFPFETGEIKAETPTIAGFRMKSERPCILPRSQALVANVEVPRKVHMGSLGTRLHQDGDSYRSVIHRVGAAQGVFWSEKSLIGQPFPLAMRFKRYSETVILALVWGADDWVMSFTLIQKGSTG